MGTSSRSISRLYDFFSRDPRELRKLLYVLEFSGCIRTGAIRVVLLRESAKGIMDVALTVTRAKKYTVH
jgi:hypothetical protein